MTIPASAIVQVVPGVIGAGGSALELNGLILTPNTSVPIGTVQSFSSAADVADFFGPAAPETIGANIYFLGYTNSTKKPGELLYAQYPLAPVGAYLRGGSLAAMSLAELQALSGELTVTVEGTAETSGPIDFAAATSFSAAAALIEASFAGGVQVAFNAQLAAFEIKTISTGAASTISFATGSLAGPLRLTPATSAVLSQGAPAGTPAANMQAIKDVTQNWAAFGTVWEPDTDGKLDFAAWVNSQNNRFVYIAWDTDPQAIVQNSATCLGAQLAAANYSGTIPVYPQGVAAAVILGAIASIDFERTNARPTFAFKSQTGIPPGVTNQTTADTLLANGYNFYGAYATANDEFSFLYNGQISGPFKWIDTYVNQIWLNNALQQALVTLLTQIPSIPYNDAGYTMIEAACMDPINAALNYGAIRAGVPLSQLQAADVNNQAGVDIAPTLQTRGWYLQIKPATAQVRAARSSPPMTFWYMDGGAVQQITLSSQVIL